MRTFAQFQFSSKHSHGLTLKMYVFILSIVLLVLSVNGQVGGIVISLRGLGNIQGVIESNSYAYLGIPYAKPPIGNLRFKGPERHTGWNTTFDGGRFGPSCLQPTARGRTSEDCLYMNIWTPQYAASSRTLLPVVIFIGGDLFSSYDASIFNGAELTSHDIIAVTFNYRLGVFGFFSMEDPKAGGNMGLLDQYLAIEWVHENIREFGGDPKQVTLMGHGAGAASTVFHMTSPRAAGRFHNAILMSGTSLAPWALGFRVAEASHMLARELGCSGGTDSVMYCLSTLDATRITQAHYHVLDFYNGTEVFGPVIDSFLPKDLQYIGRSPWEALERGEFPRIPIITGISAKDGLLMIKKKSPLYRMTPLQLKDTFENELIPEMLERSRLSRNWVVVKEVVKFAFITGAANDTSAVMDQMLDFFTEANFLAPHIHTAQFLSRHSNPVYAYVFDQDTPDPNIYSSAINSTGAWHGSILLYLFGRFAFTDQLRREYNLAEQSVSTRIQELWTNFMTTGVPTQRSQSWITWSKFTANEPIHYWLKDGRITPRGYQPYRTQFWTEFLPKLNFLGQASSPLSYPYGNSVGIPEEYREGESSVYKSATWILVGLVLTLLAVLLLVLTVLHRRRKDREFASRNTSPEVTGSRSPLPSPSPHPSSRRTRTQDQGVTILY